MVSVWIPALTAFAALLGVFVGQFWQGHREDKRWSRERELDVEHREEQRQRDHEIWAREDRHRFTEQKRQVYVDYQTRAYHVSVLLLATSKYLSQKDAAKGENFDSRALLDGLDFTRQFAEKYDDLKAVRNHIRLIAPADVLAAVTRIDQVLVPAIGSLYADARQARDLWSNLRAARFELVDAMRRDLNPGTSLLADEVMPPFVSQAEVDGEV